MGVPDGFDGVAVAEVEVGPFVPLFGGFVGLNVERPELDAVVGFVEGVVAVGVGDEVYFTSCYTFLFRIS